MRLISASLDQHNRIVVDFDEKFYLDELRFISCDIGHDRTVYIGGKQAAFWFCLHDAKNETGFAGASFTLNMLDGTTRTVKGPWSSRTGVINMLAPQLELIECVTKTMRVVYVPASVIEELGWTIEQHIDKNFELTFEAKPPVAQAAA